MKVSDKKQRLRQGLRSQCRVVSYKTAYVRTWRGPTKVNVRCLSVGLRTMVEIALFALGSSPAFAPQILEDILDF